MHGIVDMHINGMLSWKMSFQTCCLLSMTPSTPVVMKTMKEITISYHIWWFQKGLELQCHNFNIYVEHVVPHNILTSHVTSTKITIAIVSPQNAMSTSFLYWVHASSYTKCNVHIICLWGPHVNPHKMQYPRNFLWGPSVDHVRDEFHVKLALLALSARHLLTWNWLVLHVSVFWDHEKPCLMWCHIKKRAQIIHVFIHFHHIFGSSIITDFRWRPKKQSPC